VSGHHVLFFEFTTQEVITVHNVSNEKRSQVGRTYLSVFIKLRFLTDDKLRDYTCQFYRWFLLQTLLDIFCHMKGSLMYLGDIHLSQFVT